MRPGDFIDFLQSVTDAGGPEQHEYEDVARGFESIRDREFSVENGLARRTSVDSGFADLVRRNWKVFNSTATMQGFARLKPHGYAGDFEIIERIYNSNISGDRDLKRWDEFFHTADAVQAVRNRAGVLVEMCGQTDPEAILSVGCGPGLDIRPILHAGGRLNRVVLLDNDPNALKRSSANLALGAAESGIEIGIECRNALRWKTEDKFDLVWSSGLFDYLADKTASYLIRRLGDVLKPGGRLVVGNFGMENSTRAYTEVVGDWLLIHRTQADLVRIAVDAGFPESSLRVEADATGVNLFLVAER